MKKLKIVAIVGSLRKDSYNRQLALAAKAAVGNRADFVLLEYADVPFFNEDIETPMPQQVARVRSIVAAADGIWFFTPEYNHFFSGVLKNLLDWLSRSPGKSEPHPLWGKPAAISGITPGTLGTAVAQDHLVTLLSILNMRVMNVPRLTVSGALKQLNAKGQLELTTSAAFLQNQADAFVTFLQNNGCGSGL